MDSASELSPQQSNSSSAPNILLASTSQPMNFYILSSSLVCTSFFVVTFSTSQLDMSASPLDDAESVYNLLPAKKANLRDEIEVFHLQLVSLSFYPLLKV